MSKLNISSIKSGFTLIELLVVISIIGVLSALLITNLVGARTRAADAKKKAELNAFVTSLRLYYNDYQAYPLSGGISGKLNNLAGGAAWAVAGVTYMKALPMDYFYYPGLTTDEFLAYVKLSNASDDQLAKNFAKCCPSGTTRPNCPTSLTSNQYILCEN